MGHPDDSPRGLQNMSDPIDVADYKQVQQAQARIKDKIRLTPVLNELSLDAELNCQLFCKCENLQRTGAFKFRGASNAIARLREKGIAGDVATHSSGNHGAALALAASLEGRMAHVVMPENSSKLKISAVQRYGGIVYLCPPTQQDREDGLQKLVDAGHIPIPPYDHLDIISGQGTATLELLQSHPQLDALMTPVGGGGLISGAVLAAANHNLQLYAAEPQGADDTARSMQQGQRVDSVQGTTIADGLRALVGVRNFAIIRDGVRKVLTVDEDAIRSAMGEFWNHTRMLIEPSSAVVIAAIRQYPEHFSGKKLGVIISGGNIDPADWLSLVRSGEAK
jgi:threonine dehydratase